MVQMQIRKILYSCERFWIGAHGRIEKRRSGLNSRRPFHFSAQLQTSGVLIHRGSLLSNIGRFRLLLRCADKIFISRFAGIVGAKGRMPCRLDTEVATWSPFAPRAGQLSVPLNPLCRFGEPECARFYPWMRQLIGKSFEYSVVSNLKCKLWDLSLGETRTKG